MKNYIIAGICGLMLLTAVSCSKEGEAIKQPSISYLKFTTYTIDTFQFRIIVNDVMLTDSLRSPIGTETRLVEFMDSMASFKVINDETGVIYLDSTIKLRPEQTTVSIVQFISGESPFLPTPPTEAPPAEGNYKVRFKYVQPQNSSDPFYDSIKCVIRLSSVPVDTIVLKKYEESAYYEASYGSNYSMRILNAETSATIDLNTNNLSSGSFTKFNTAIFNSTTSSTNYIIKRVY